MNRLNQIRCAAIAGVVAELFLASTVLGQTPSAEPILAIDGATVDSYPASATVAQDIQPLIQQRGVGLDGSLRSDPPFGWVVNANPFAHDWNDNARYRDDIMLHTGRYSPTELDLALPAPGFSWTVGRTYSVTENGVPSLGYQGYNWQQFSQPEVVYLTNGGSGDRVYLVYGADRFLEFKRLDGSSPVYRGVNGAAGAMVAGADGSHGLFVYWDQHGTRSVFFDPRDGDNVVTDGSSVNHDGRGQLWKITDAAGNAAYVGDDANPADAIEAGYDVDRRMLVAYDTADRKYVYEYDVVAGTGGSTSLNETFLSSVEAFVDDGMSGWESTGAKVEYGYYTDVVANRGAYGYLRLVTVTLPLPQFDAVSAAGEVETATTYYGYSTVSGIEDQAVIARVLGPEGYRSLKAENPLWNIDTITTGNLDPYLSYEFSYHIGVQTPPGSVNTMWEIAIASARMDGLEDEIDFKYFVYDRFMSVATANQYDPEHAALTQVIANGYNAAGFTLYFDEAGQPLTRMLDTAGENKVFELVSRGEIDMVDHMDGVIEMIASPLACEANTDWNPDAPGTYTMPSALRTAFDNPMSSEYSADGALIRVFPQPESGVYTGFMLSRSWQSVPTPTLTKHGPHAVEEYDYLSAVYDDSASVDVGDDYLVVRPLLWKQRTFNNYRYTSGSDPLYFGETTFSYEFHEEDVNGGGTTDPQSPEWLAPRRVRTTHPVVTTGNNGPNVAATSDMFYRADGTEIFRRDETDVYSYLGLVNNEVVRRVADIRLSNNSHFVGTDDPDDYWSPVPLDPGSAEIQNSTTYTRDTVGRVLTEVMPSGRTITHRYEELADGRVARVSSRGSSGANYVGPFDYLIWNDEGMRTVEATIAVASTSTAPAGWIDDNEDDLILAASLGSLGSLEVLQYNSAGLTPSVTGLYHTIPASGLGDRPDNYDQELYEFDAAGDLTSIERMSGTVNDFLRDPRGLIYARQISSFDPAGSGGGIRTAASNDGDESADADGFVIGGYCNCVAISDEGACLRSTNVNDYHIQNDIFGRPVFLQRAAAPYYAVRYDNLGRVTTIAIYSALLDGLSVSSLREEMNPDLFNEYDPDLHGPDVEATHRVALLSIDYDERGRVVRRTLDKINPSNGTVEVGESLEWTYTYDAAGRVIREQADALLKREYDRLGREVAVYELSGMNDSAYADADDLSGEVVERETHRIVQKSTGLVLMEVVSDRTEADYGSGEHRGKLDANSYTTLSATTVNPANLEGRAQITLFEYDSIDRLESVAFFGTGGTDSASTFDPDGGSMPASLTTQYAYDDAGRLATITDPAGRVEFREYDDAGRLTRLTENFVDPPSMGVDDENRVTEWTYLNGQLVEYTAEDDTGTQTTEYVYEASGVTGDSWPSRELLRKVIFPDSGEELFHYSSSSNLAKRIDPAGNEIAFGYDLPGRVSELTLAAASGFDATVAKIELEYAPIGRLGVIRQLDSGDDEIDSVSIAYDGWTNVVEFAQDPDGGLGAFDPKVLEYLWDLGPVSGGRRSTRMTGMTLPSGRGVEYAYASISGSNGGPNLLSRVSSVEYDSTIVSEYDYLGVDTVSETRYPTNVSGYPVYSSLRDGSGDFDALDEFNRPVRSRWNRVRQYNAPSSEVPFYDITVLWDDNSNVTGYTDHVLSDFFNSEFTIDGLNRLVGSKRGDGSGSGVSLPAVEVETWDLSTVGNWQAHGLELNGDNPPDYSDAGEFQSEGIFNLVNEMTSLEKDTDNDSVADVTYTRSYNDRGDLTDDGENYTYKYDVLGRLVEIRNRSTSDLLSQYKYNGLGYRTGERIDSDLDGVIESGETDWRYFIYDARWRLIEVYEDTDDVNPLEVYVHHAAGLDGTGTGSYIDHLILRERNTNPSVDTVLDEFHFYCQNWRADVVAILDESGRQVEQVRYTPYGVPIAIPFAEQRAEGVLNGFDSSEYLARYNAIGYEVLADRDLDGDRDFFDVTGFVADYNATPVVGRGTLSNFGHRFGYAGYWYVAERGVCHVRSRWYDLNSGRWITRDPMGYVDGGLLYAYLQNKSLGISDPYGLGPLEWYKNAWKTTANHIDETNQMITDEFHQFNREDRDRANRGHARSKDEALRLGYQDDPPEKEIFHTIGAPGNDKMSHPETGHEVVFDLDGNVVTEPINRGTFNYIPANGPISGVGHMCADVGPWILDGTGEDDPTHWWDRFVGTLKGIADAIY